MAVDDVREAAKAELRRREWANERGRATRAYIRDNPAIVEEFDRVGDVPTDAIFPRYVTRASILLELNLRARRRETTKEVREWEREHPEEALKIREEAKREYGLSHSSKKASGSGRGEVARRS